MTVTTPAKKEKVASKPTSVKKKPATKTTPSVKETIKKPVKKAVKKPVKKQKDGIKEEKPAPQSSTPDTEVKSTPPPPPPAPIEENKSIGIENINVIVDSLDNVSIIDILSSNENPDMTNMINNMLAIS